MIIIADSGSTKCDWQVIQNDQPIAYTHTHGINPFFHSAEVIESFIQSNEELMNIAHHVEKIYFYCAGGSNAELNKEVARGLNRVFKDAHAVVDHDLDGAAYATWNGKPGITCILGTGSNSIYFDGENLREEVPALAYILGDEGSGSYYGKKLLADYLYKRLPQPIHKALRDEMKLTKEIILENVYMKPNANVFLASFMRLIHRFIDQDYVQDMIREGKGRFLDTHVMCYPEAKSVPIHFIGSVAHFFSDILQEEVEKRGLIMGTILKKPIDGLVNYHIHSQNKIER
jgi:glucosamine kinase